MEFFYVLPRHTTRDNEQNKSEIDWTLSLSRTHFRKKLVTVHLGPQKEHNLLVNQGVHSILNYVTFDGKQVSAIRIYVDIRERKSMSTIAINTMSTGYYVGIQTLRIYWQQKSVKLAIDATEEFRFLDCQYFHQCSGENNFKNTTALLITVFTTRIWCRMMCLLSHEVCSMDIQMKFWGFWFFP